MNNQVKRTNGNSNMPQTFSGLVDKIFQNNVNRLFDDDFWGFSNVSQNVSIPVNVRETDRSYELELVAPGLKKEDLKINVQGEILTVSFEHQTQQEHENKDEGWLRKEYQKKSFTRTFNLGEAIDANKIDAKYSDGILHLSLQKKEGAGTTSRNIEVN